MREREAASPWKAPRKKAGQEVPKNLGPFRYHRFFRLTQCANNSLDKIEVQSKALGGMSPWCLAVTDMVFFNHRIIPICAQFPTNSKASRRLGTVSTEKDCQDPGYRR